MFPHIKQAKCLVHYEALREKPTLKVTSLN